MEVNSSVGDPTSLEINPSTGLATGNWKQTRSIPVAEISNETPVYFISMVKNASVTVTATAYDTDDKVIISHTINGVSLVPNKKTIATGTFFQSSGSGTFTVNSEWLTDNNIEY